MPIRVLGNMPIRVFLIEPHGVVRAGVKMLLDAEPDLAVAGEAADGRGALWHLARLGAEDRPADVVVMEVALPDMGGAALTHELKALYPATRVLWLTAHHDGERLEGLLETGVDGYLLKQGAAEELAPAIRTVAGGESAVAPQVAGFLLRHVRGRRERERHQTMLSAREREILDELAAGSTSKEIARRLGLSAKTVENHRARILEKLGAANVAGAVNIAAQSGLLAAIA